MGGDLYLEGTTVIDACEFAVSGPKELRGIVMYSGANLTISNSNFLSQGGSGDPIITSVGFEVTLIRNRFVAHEGQMATTVFLGQDFAGVYPQQFRIVENLFYNDDPDQYGRQTALSFSGPDLDVEISGNTFVGCGIYGDFAGHPLKCQHNIFYKSAVVLHAPGSHLTCNCVSDSSYWRPNPSVTWSDMVFHDPIFCGPEAGDFHISREGPCAEGHSPGACGTIGLYEPACDLNPVEERSWGSIKARFLRKLGDRAAVDSVAAGGGSRRPWSPPRK
jgi:hypothetical protein